MESGKISNSQSRGLGPRVPGMPNQRKNPFSTDHYHLFQYKDKTKIYGRIYGYIIYLRLETRSISRVPSEPFSATTRNLSIFSEFRLGNPGIQIRLMPFRSLDVLPLSTHLHKYLAVDTSRFIQSRHVYCKINRSDRVRG